MSSQRIRIRLKAFDHRLIDQSARDRRDRQTHRRTGSRPYPVANQDGTLHCADFAACQQGRP